MKKGVILLMLLVLLPAAYASITINEDSIKTVYNAGSKIAISGAVSGLAEGDYYLRITLTCNEKSFFSMPTKFYFDGSMKLFPQEIKVPVITTKAEMAGKCVAKAAVIYQKNVIDNATSDEFEISTVLKSNFENSEFKVQLGKPVYIKGVVYDLDNNPIDGYATIYFNDESSSYSIGDLTFEKGMINFEYKTSSTLAGEYSIDIFARDLSGNSQMFTNVAKLILVDKLNVLLTAGTDKILPGESFNVNGEAKDILQEGVGNANVVLVFDSSEYKLTTDEGHFGIELESKDTIKSGEHKIIAEVKDEFGNSGSASAYIFVQPVVSSISIISEEQVCPNNYLKIKTPALDQAKDPMTASVYAEIVNPDDDVVFSKSTQSTEEIMFKVPQFAEPGTWLIKVKNGSAKAEKTFTVNTVSNISINVAGSQLVITNIGNVKYKGKFEVEIDGAVKDYNLERKKTIGVNETLVIDLENEVPAGDYEIKVPNIQGDVIGDVSVKKGKERVSLNSLYIIATIVGIAIILFLMSFNIQPKYKHLFRTPKKHKREVVEEPKKMPYGKAGDKDIEDFKQRVLAEVKKMEDMDSKRQKYKSNEEPENKGGLFNIFN